MKTFTISRKRSLIQSLKALAGFLIGLNVVLQIFTDIDRTDFLIGSLFGSVVVFLCLFYPRDIFAGDRYVSFVSQNGFREHIAIQDIVKEEVCKRWFCRSICITTKHGKKYQLYPQDFTTPEEIISRTNNSTNLL